ncbi:Isy1p [Saccharomyces cerevisiae x Saccharomyces kudriavzevii VIN7]|uniref:Pre-mRNA-splicing factor ISY1 n=1 Tax=Saccharomyces cerevisiae x Saccharomyces kudriavzevii (strain VIN7) TaxID=1095631 RepID=H0GX05_SACCK|nr:Isy1p [Saccharomyces cerevisiae x Saccharomyces kudriavzevii VIN7]
MSRNVDKANSVLVRFQEQQAESATGYKDYSRYKRPKNVSRIKSLKEANEWKRQVSKEIQQKSTRIYDPSLNEVQIAELNDELNDLFKEWKRWQWHINHTLMEKKTKRKTLEDGHLLANAGKLIHGKRYFGRALELPEVKEWQESQKQNSTDIVNIKRVPKNRNDFYYHGKATAALTEFETNWTPILKAHYNVPVNEREEEETTQQTQEMHVPALSDMEHWLVQRRKKKLMEELNL